MLDGLVFRHLLVDLSRLTWALLIVASLLPVGRVVRRLWGAPENSLFDIGIGCGVVGALLRCLAALGFAHRSGVLALMGLVLIAGLASVPAVVRNIREKRHDVGQDGETGHDRWWLALVIALPALVMALAPPASFDELAYHLRVPEVALQTGSWPLDLANSATFYPSATEALYLPALALDPSGVTAKVIHFLFFLLLLTAAGRIAAKLSDSPEALSPFTLHSSPFTESARSSPFSEHARNITILMIGSVPALGIAGGWALADAPLLFLLACAALALLEDKNSDAVAMLGCAAAVKYSALLFGLPLLVLALRRRDALRGMVAGGVIALPWYVTNVVATGNPIYPMLSSSANAAWMAGQSRLAYLTRPEGLDNDLGGLLLLVMLALVLFALTRRELRIPAIVALAMVAVVVPFLPTGRVLLPAVVAVLVVAACMLVRLPFLGTAVAGIFVIRGLLVIAGHNALFFSPAPVVAGLQSETEYVEHNAPLVSLYRQLAGALPVDASVLVVGEPRLFGFPARTSGAGLPDPPAIRPFVAAGGDLAQRLRAAGFSHVLVGIEPLNGKTTMQGRRRDIALTPEESAALEKLMLTSETLARTEEVCLLKLH